jgi:hypothetical protein
MLLNDMLSSKGTMAEKGIVYRLGWVLYWAFCIIAGLAALLAGIGIITHIAGALDQDEAAIVFWLGLGVFAFMVWLMGRAIRYVLAGD